MTIQENLPSARRARWKLPARFAPQVFAFYMAAIMAMLMCTVIVAVSSGVGEGFALRVLHAYRLAMPVAFLCVLVVRPLVMHLVKWTVQL